MIEKRLCLYYTKTVVKRRGETAKVEQTKEIVSIEGSVENIIFKNEDSGFTVMELGYQGDLLTVVGELYGVAEGEEVKLSGYFTSHPQYGHQFKALTCERNLPATANAILKYLSSGALKGVGPVTARRFVERFGDDTLTVIENEPERLLEVRGITERRANQIREEFNKIFGVRAVMSFMAQFQILPIYSIRVWRTFGSAAIEIIQDNPFLLCSNGIDLNFSKADEIRERAETPLMGIPACHLTGWPKQQKNCLGSIWRW